MITAHDRAGESAQLFMASDALTLGLAVAFGIALTALVASPASSGFASAWRSPRHRALLIAAALSLGFAAAVALIAAATGGNARVFK